MAGIPYPLWTTLKSNTVTMLEEVATEETLISAARNFLVQKNRWRPWIEAQQKIALVNVLVQTIGQDNERSSAHVSSLDNVTVFVDMYALGRGGEVLPADEISSDRLDLLTNQVREGLTRLKNHYFLFPTENIVDGEDLGPVIDTDLDFTLTYYDQENEQTTGQYAPARWSFNVQLAYIPTDNNDYNDLTELNISVKDDTLEQYSLRFEYTP